MLRITIASIIILYVGVLNAANGFSKQLALEVLTQLQVGKTFMGDIQDFMEADITDPHKFFDRLLGIKDIASLGFVKPFVQCSKNADLAFFGFSFNGKSYSFIWDGEMVQSYPLLNRNEVIMTYKKMEKDQVNRIVKEDWLTFLEGKCMPPSISSQLRAEVEKSNPTDQVGNFAKVFLKKLRIILSEQIKLKASKTKTKGPPDLRINKIIAINNAWALIEIGIIKKEFDESLSLVYDVKTGQLYPFLSLEEARGFYEKIRNETLEDYQRNETLEDYQRNETLEDYQRNETLEDYQLVEEFLSQQLSQQERKVSLEGIKADFDPKVIFNALLSGMLNNEDVEKAQRIRKILSETIFVRLRKLRPDILNVDIKLNDTKWYNLIHAGETLYVYNKTKKEIHDILRKLSIERTIHLYSGRVDDKVHERIETILQTNFPYDLGPIRRLLLEVLRDIARNKSPLSCSCGKHAAKPEGPIKEIFKEKENLVFKICYSCLLETPYTFTYNLKTQTFKVEPDIRILTKGQDSVGASSKPVVTAENQEFGPSGLSNKIELPPGLENCRPLLPPGLVLPGMDNPQQAKPEEQQDDSKSLGHEPESAAKPRYTREELLLTNQTIRHSDSAPPITLTKAMPKEEMVLDLLTRIPPEGIEFKRKYEMTKPETVATLFISEIFNNYLTMDCRNIYIREAFITSTDPTRFGNLYATFNLLTFPEKVYSIVWNPNSQRVWIYPHTDSLESEGSIFNTLRLRHTLDSYTSDIHTGDIEEKHLLIEQVHPLKEKKLIMQLLKAQQVAKGHPNWVFDKDIFVLPRKDCSARIVQITLQQNSIHSGFAIYVVYYNGRFQAYKTHEEAEDAYNKIKQTTK